MESMETVEIVYGALIIIQAFFLLWFGTLIKAQKTVVDSFKAKSDSLKSTHEMWLNQIKDETFQNAVNYAVRGKELKYQDEIKNLKQSDKQAQELLTELLLYKFAFHRLVGMSAIFRILYPDKFKHYSELVKFEELELDDIEMVSKAIIETISEENKLKMKDGLYKQLSDMLLAKPND